MASLGKLSTPNPGCPKLFLRNLHCASRNACADLKPLYPRTMRIGESCSVTKVWYIISLSNASLETSLCGGGIMPSLQQRLGRRVKCQTVVKRCQIERTVHRCSKNLEALCRNPRNHQSITFS